MDNFLEEIVVKKNRTATNLLYGLLMVLMVVFGLLAAMMLSAVMANFNLPALIELLVFAGLAFLIFWKKDILRTEYEYTFTNGEMDFAKVLGNNKRKSLGSMRIKNLEACGHVKHSSFQRYITMPGVVKTNWFLNRDGNLFYFFYTKDSKKHVVVAEPSEAMAELIRQYAARGAYQG